MTRLDPELETLWKEVLDRWDHEPAHGAFLDYCVRTDQLVEAAARYRELRGDRERGESAGKRLQGITILAMAKLESARTRGARASPSRVGRLVLLVLLVLLAAATVILLAALQARR
jgi:hypothetical protein